MPAINQLPYGVGFSGYYGGNAASVLEANRKRGVLVQALTRTRTRTRTLASSCRRARHYASPQP